MQQFKNFPTLRPVQKKIVADCLAAPTRFMFMDAPTGIGKSLAGMAYGKSDSDSDIDTKRVCYLTGTKQLMGQIIKDFSPDGLAQIRGKANYSCGEYGGRVDDAPCNYGTSCELKWTSDCEYYGDLIHARNSSMVVTNYAYYMALKRFVPPDKGLGNFDVLICDEAHNVPDLLSSFLTGTVELREIRMVLNMPGPVNMYEETVYAWAKECMKRAESFTNAHEDKGNMREANRSAGLTQELRWLLEILSIDEETILYKEKDSIVAVPLWPGELAEKYLFANSKKVVMMSATMNKGLAGQVGLSKHDYTYLNYASPFDPDRCPIHYWPLCKLNWKTTEQEFARMVKNIDSEIDRREDIRIFMPTGSYARTELILKNSRHADRMITHGRGGFNNALDEYLNTEGAILVTPSAVEGVDLKDDRCRCIIYPKYPYPDTRSPEMKARTEDDKDWVYVQSMQKFEQAIGRAMRSVDDYCEVVICDANWGWIGPKVKSLGLGSEFFWSRIGKVQGLPPPIHFKYRKEAGPKKRKRRVRKKLANTR